MTYLKKKLTWIRNFRSQKKQTRPLKTFQKLISEFSETQNQAVKKSKRKKKRLFLSGENTIPQWWTQDMVFFKENSFLDEKFQKDKKISQKQKKIRFLRHVTKSKLPYQFFQPWKRLKLPLTKKQQWLGMNYNRYQKLDIQDRIDFFRTYIGQILLSTEMHSQSDYKDSWISQARFSWQTQRNEIEQKRYDKIRVSREHMYLQLTLLQKKTWWYENLVQKQRRSVSEKAFRLDRPNTAFQQHWKQQKREPWKDSLLFKRALYEGFGERLRKENKFKILKIKPYLRRKNPRREKRNRLYHRNNILLTNFRHKNRIRADKVARIKQIVGKILRPFYGNLRQKQMKIIFKKCRQKKSSYLTSNEMILNRFENRLDVVIYRMNLAPTILWARRLILNGSVFVQTLQKAKSWDWMYSSVKKLAFPLKLRDPYHLYDKKLWTHFSNRGAKFKFLGQPKYKISYLVQPGDIIQCASGFRSNQFKTKHWLWQKPIPSHLMVNKKKKFFWAWRFQKYTHRGFNSWEQNTETTTSATMLHMPQFCDLDSKDRVQESFLRWVIL